MSSYNGTGSLYGCTDFPFVSAWFIGFYMLYVSLYFLKRRNRGLGAFSRDYDSGYIVCEDGGLLEALSFCQHDSQRRCEGIACSGCIYGVYRDSGNLADPGLFRIHVDAFFSKCYQNVFNSFLSFPGLGSSAQPNSVAPKETVKRTCAGPASVHHIQQGQIGRAHV